MEIIKDWEIRFQNNLYWFAKKLQNSSKSNRVVLIEVQNSDLPDLDQIYPLPKKIHEQLSRLIGKIDPKSNTLIIYNLLLNHVGKGQRAFEKHTSLILRKHSIFATPKTYRFKKQGKLRLRTDSNGIVQFICSNEKTCGGDSLFGEAFRAIHRKKAKVSSQEWFRINYSPLTQEVKGAGKSFLTLSLKEALQLDANIFKDSVLIIGKKLKGFDPLFPSPIQNREVSESEILALAILSSMEGNEIISFLIGLLC